MSSNMPMREAVLLAEILTDALLPDMDGSDRDDVGALLTSRIMLWQVDHHNPRLTGQDAQARQIGRMVRDILADASGEHHNAPQWRDYTDRLAAAWVASRN